ncbi:MFS transporter [Dietzia kunjamensis]|uniref:MFS transporter n=1 Tax=Dietzia TaxID=37914 RepID=UPI000BDEFFF3|nr:MULTISPECIES: MFS transporter [Dietzia]MVZ90832.1 MFS transporter [Microbacter sp. ANSKLAB05]HBD21941.1 MFS transporter [Dietzia sp.]MCZ4539498.1 MFS transporter [Dietzia maris]MCZ4655525.1 MFS transporter [Dietzia kunjamensis]MDJ0423202.1 MFS transporter [Dietzia kunjamensis]
MTPRSPRASSRQGALAFPLVALVGVVLVSLNLRTAVTSLSPLLGVIDAEIGLGAAGMGLLGMVPTAMFAVWGVLTPIVLRRVGLEMLTVLAMVAAAVGQLIRAAAHDPWVMGAGSLIALAGMGIGNVVAPPLVKKYFPRHVAAVSMAYITGLQLGTVVPALVAVPVEEAAGWRVSIGWWAVLAVVAAIPWIVEVVRPGVPTDSPRATGSPRPADGSTGSAPTSAPTSAPGGSAATPTRRIRPWRSPVGVALALFFGTNSLCTYAFFTWLPAVAESIGMTRAEGGLALAVYSAIGLVAALVVPWAAGRFEDPYAVVVVSVVSYLAGFAGLLWAPGAAWVWICLLGVGPSTFPLCLTLINLRTRTQAGSAALSGFSQGVGYTAASLGPLVFGMLFDGPGLGAGLAFLTVVLAIMTVVSRTACRPNMLEDTLR